MAFWFSFSVFLLDSQTTSKMIIYLNHHHNIIAGLERTEQLF